MISVALYSQDPTVRTGLEAFVRQEGTLELVCSSDTVSTLVAEAGRNMADVLLVEASPAITASKLRKLAANRAAIPVILWVGYSPTSFLAQAISFGVRGILRKGLPVDSALECLREVARGGLWLERELAHRMLLSPPIHFTPREQQVMMLLAQGLTNEEIAVGLGLTPGTVKGYLGRLCKKVGVVERLALALYALENFYCNPTVAQECESQSAHEGACGNVRRVRRVVHRSIQGACDASEGDRFEADVRQQYTVRTAVVACVRVGSATPSGRGPETVTAVRAAGAACALGPTDEL